MRFAHSAALYASFLAICRLNGQASLAASPSPSAIVEPAAAAVKQALATISVDRWKVARSARDKTSENLDSITKDIGESLPSLVSGADSQPTSPVALLPLTRNLTALYEVVLRVSVVAESSAPKDQATSLQRALTNLQAARHMLEDRVQATAVDQDGQLTELRKTLAAAKAGPAAAPATAPPPPCQPSNKKKRSKPASTS